MTPPPQDTTPHAWEDNFQYWQELYEIVNSEPPFEGYREHYGELASVGIAKDQPFSPDARMKRILEDAAKMGCALMRVESFADRRPDRVVWKDRQWQQTCGVTLAEVQAAAPLLTTDGDDILVWRYPVAKESEVQHLRALGRAKTAKKAEAARANGAQGGRPKNPDNPTETQRKTERKETQETQRKPIEGKGREGKENRKEGEGTAPHDPFRPTLEQAVGSMIAPKPMTEIWWNDCMARSGDGPFLRFDGRPMASWQHDLTSYAQRERSRSAERMHLAGAKFVPPAPNPTAHQTPEDPAGWKEWLADQTADYRGAHSFAPQFLQTAFAQRAK